jgi:hypothetical protein
MRQQLITVLGSTGIWSLSACAPSAMGPHTIFADPAKYQYHNCEQLAEKLKTVKEREQELRLLMDKSEQSVGGAVVNVIAYQAEYTNAREEIKVIDATWNAKRCR